MSSSDSVRQGEMVPIPELITGSIAAHTDSSGFIIDIDPFHFIPVRMLFNDWVLLQLSPDVMVFTTMNNT